MFDHHPVFVAGHYQRDKLLSTANELINYFRLPTSQDRYKLRGATRHLAGALDGCSGLTLQQRWNDFERKVWPQWKTGIDRPIALWTWVARLVVPARIIVPTMNWLTYMRVNQWIARLPKGHPLLQQYNLLLQATGAIAWASSRTRHLAVCNRLRLLLARGYDSLHSIQDDDLKLLSARGLKGKGIDVLDGALCSLGVFSRTPKRASARHSRGRRLTAPELIEIAGVPERFRRVMILYLETYEARVSDVYRTLRQKSISLAHFWRFIDNQRFSAAETQARK